jgi:Zn finger protein HypA/HybF involved in hydrogenase expression
MKQFRIRIRKSRGLSYIQCEPCQESCMYNTKNEYFCPECKEVVPDDLYFRAYNLNRLINKLR